MKKNILFVCSLMLGLCACEKEIDFRGGETEPKITLNSLLSPDEPVSLSLFKSRFFLSDNNGFAPLPDAVVTLWKDDAAVETLRSGEQGRFVAEYIPQVGDRLRITAAASGLDPVECAAEILPPPRIVSAEIASAIDNLEFDLIVTLSDPAGTADFYRFDFMAALYDEKNGSYYNRAPYYSSDDLVFGSATSNPLEESENYFYNFSDELFNGKEYKIKFHIRVPYYERQTAKDYLCIELQHITKDYHLYLQSYAATLLGGSDDTSGLFTEPVQVFSNIRGGVGILGSCTKTVYEVGLGKGI
jgi:hypothetical protein